MSRKLCRDSRAEHLRDQQTRKLSETRKPSGVCVMGGLELRTYLLGLALITAGLAASFNETVNQQVFPNQPIYTSLGSDLPTRQFGATATQTLFNGFQTANGARRAESQ